MIPDVGLVRHAFSGLPLVLLLVVSPVRAIPAVAQDPAGTWLGQWERAGSILEVELTFRRTTSGFEGSLSSEGLRVVGIPLARIRFETPTLSWELVGDATTSRFEGALQSDVLAGRFQEGDATGTFRLVRATTIRSALRQEEATFTSGAVTLSGTVILPDGAGPFPAVVFLHGSGAEGRWASLHLANAFARRGIASLAYDKRGVGASTGDWRDAGFEDLVADASAAVEALRSRPGILPDRVGIHGHSQGATYAPMLASRNPHVAFVVASAASGMPMAETEIYSLENAVGMRSLPEPDQRIAEEYVRAIVATAYGGAPRKDMQAAYLKVHDRPWAFAPPPESDSYWSFSRRIAAYDPLACWRGVTAPVLLVYGASDERVPPRASAARIAETVLGSRGSRLDVIIFPDADHSFRLPPRTPDTFEWPRTAPGYPEGVVDWVVDVTAR